MAAKKKPAAKPKPSSAAVASSPPGAHAAFWKNPADLNALRVWADALLEAGEPRGEFIALHVLPSRTPEQSDRMFALEKKLGGKLVGPARPFVRLYEFGDQGLVTSITTEASNLVKGFELIAGLNPRLTAEVTSLRKKGALEAIAALPLHRIFDLRLHSNQLTDGDVTELAPSLKGVKRLSLAFNKITAAGLRAYAPHAEGLEFLGIGYFQDVELAGGWHQFGTGMVEAILETPQFRDLRAVYLGGVKVRPALITALKAMPKMKMVLSSWMPPSTEEIDSGVPKPR